MLLEENDPPSTALKVNPCLIFVPSADRVMHFQLLYPIEVQRTKKDLIKLLMEEEVPSSNQKSQPKISAASPEPSVSVQVKIYAGHNFSTRRRVN